MNKLNSKSCFICQNEFIPLNKSSKICYDCQSEAVLLGFEGFRYCRTHKNVGLVLHQRTLCRGCLDDKLKKCVVCNSKIDTLRRSDTCSTKCSIYNSKETREITNLSRYGSKYIYGSEYFIKMSKDKWGCENPGQLDYVKDKINKSKNNSYKYKKYIDYSGKIWTYQGSENKTLEVLFEYGFKSDEINKTFPRISYNDKDKIRRYFPDFMINNDIIVESKSWYYWNKDIELNIKKISASLKLGYFVLLVIWDKRTKNYQIKFFDDPTKPLIVTDNARTAGNISQSINTTQNQTTVQRT